MDHQDEKKGAADEGTKGDDKSIRNREKHVDRHRQEQHEQGRPDRVGPQGKKDKTISGSSDDRFSQAKAG
jgi:hypothetical protein